MSTFQDLQRKLSESNQTIELQRIRLAQKDSEIETLKQKSFEPWNRDIENQPENTMLSSLLMFFERGKADQQWIETTQRWAQGEREKHLVDLVVSFSREWQRRTTDLEQLQAKHQQLTEEAMILKAENALTTRTVEDAVKSWESVVRQKEAKIKELEQELDQKTRLAEHNEKRLQSLMQEHTQAVRQAGQLNTQRMAEEMQSINAARNELRQHSAQLVAENKALRINLDTVQRNFAIKDQQINSLTQQLVQAQQTVQWLQAGAPAKSPVQEPQMSQRAHQLIASTLVNYQNENTQFKLKVAEDKKELERLTNLVTTLQQQNTRLEQELTSAQSHQKKLEQNLQSSEEQRLQLEQSLLASENSRKQLESSSSDNQKRTEQSKKLKRSLLPSEAIDLEEDNSGASVQLQECMTCSVYRQVLAQKEIEIEQLRQRVQLNLQTPGQENSGVQTTIALIQAENDRLNALVKLSESRISQLTRLCNEQLQTQELLTKEKAKNALLTAHQKEQEILALEIKKASERRMDPSQIEQLELILDISLQQLSAKQQIATVFKTLQQRMSELKELQDRQRTRQTQTTSQQRQIDKLQQDLKEYKQELTQTRQKLRQSNKEVKKLTVAAEDDYLSLTISLNEAHHLMKQQLEEIELLKQYQGNVEESKTLLEHVQLLEIELSKEKTKRRQKQKILERMEGRVLHLSLEQENKHREFAALGAALEDCKATLKSKETQYTQLLHKFEAKSKEIEDLQKSLQPLQSALDAKERERFVLQVKVNGLEQELLHAREALDQASARTTLSDTTHKQSNDFYRRIRRELSEAKDSLQKKHAQITVLTTDLDQANANHAELTQRHENIKQQLITLLERIQNVTHVDLDFNVDKAVVEAADAVERRLSEKEKSEQRLKALERQVDEHRQRSRSGTPESEVDRLNASNKTLQQQMQRTQQELEEYTRTIFHGRNVFRYGQRKGSAIA
ncbi:hypothetical protein EDD86DRAFT_146022 [Gorgonomyces haynaldii]|nr:hypothetical protein EDD86DRAFT_146022 [Gorgonomyces haynaldii]